VGFFKRTPGSFKSLRGPFKVTRCPSKGPRCPLKGPRGFSKGPRGSLKSTRGSLKGLRGPLKGPRGPFKGPRCPFKGPRGLFKGSRCPFKGPRGPLTRPRGQSRIGRHRGSRRSRGARSSGHGPAVAGGVCSARPFPRPLPRPWPSGLGAGRFGLGGGVGLLGCRGQETPSGLLQRTAGTIRKRPGWALEGRRAGDFRAGFLGSFGRSRPPSTHDRRGPPRTSPSTKRQEPANGLGGFQTVPAGWSPKLISHRGLLPRPDAS